MRFSSHYSVASFHGANGCITFDVAHDLQPVPVLVDVTSLCTAAAGTPSIAYYSERPPDPSAAPRPGEPQDRVPDPMVSLPFDLDGDRA